MTEEPKLGTPAVARMLGITPATWRAYRSEGRTPTPDGLEPVSGRAWWYPSTIERWHAQRPGPGARTDLKRAV